LPELATKPQGGVEEVFRLGGVSVKKKEIRTADNIRPVRWVEKSFEGPTAKFSMASGPLAAIHHV
jgi:hypothetical protein